MDVGKCMHAAPYHRISLWSKNVARSMYRSQIRPRWPWHRAVLAWAYLCIDVHTHPMQPITVCGMSGIQKDAP